MKTERAYIKVSREIEGEFPFINLTFKKKKVKCDVCNKVKQHYVWLSITHGNGGEMGWGRVCSKNCLISKLQELKLWLNECKND